MITGTAKAAIYARYSTDMQRDASIEDQIRLCQERADKEGWRLHNSYTDHGTSGATLIRPGIQMLLQDAMDGKFDIILSEALDRLSRDQEDIAGIYKRLSFAGVKIVTLSEGEVDHLHTCDNRRTMKREDLEATILNGLQHHLMDPALCEVFAEEYTRHLNKIRMDKNASIEAAKAELIRIDRETNKLIDAICDGVPAINVKDRMWELEYRKTELESLIANTEEEPVLIHPAMSKVYRDQVAQLCEALNEESRRAEAVDLIRSLVDRIVLTPAEINGKKTMEIDLHGHLAGILSLSAQTKKPLNESDLSVESIKMVAGVGFEPTTFRL